MVRTYHKNSMNILSFPLFPSLFLTTIILYLYKKLLYNLLPTKFHEMIIIINYLLIFTFKFAQ